MADFSREVSHPIFPAMICIVGSDFKIKYVNESVALNLRCKSNDLIGRPVWEMLRGVDSKITKEYIMEIIETETPMEFKSEVSFPVGKRTLMTTLIPFFGEGGIITDFIGVAYDISVERDNDQVVRNKMSVVLGYADLLSEIIEDDELREKMEKIKDVCNEIRERLDRSG